MQIENYEILINVVEFKWTKSLSASPKDAHIVKVV